MSPAFPALLCLGLCLGHRMKAQADKLPRPSLRAENGSLGPLGRSVTLRCRGSPGAAEYFLEKYQQSRYEHMDSKLSQEDEVEFPISSMSLSDTGTYSCHYRTEYYWSERSEPLELVATDRYDAPSLSAQPNSTVAEGQAVTLWCCSGNRYDRSALYKDGEQVTKARAQLLNEGAQANFSIPAVTSAHGGTYRCYSFQRLSPHEWSFPSDPLELRVTGTSKDPSLPPSPGGTQALTPSPPSEELETNTGSSGDQNWLFGLSKKHGSILLGVSALLILLFLLLLLLLCCRRCWTKISNGSRGAEAKKTPKSSDPAATPMEETLYAAVEDGSRTQAGPEDTAAPPGEDPQQVTYAQLNLGSLRAGAQEPPPSARAEPSLYAALR
ncbi:platelet glycoprotein VI-like [Sarcophilus harrisii]